MDNGVEDFDIDSLLGDDLVKNLMEHAKDDNKITKPESLELAPNDLERNILNRSNEMLSTLDNAIYDVMEQISLAPTDTDIIDSASKLISSRSNLTGTLEKIYLNREKFKQQLILTQMKLSSQQNINKENNDTKILLTREEVLKNITNASKTKDLAKDINLLDNEDY